MSPIIVTQVTAEDFNRRTSRVGATGTAYWLCNILHQTKNAPYRAFAIIKTDAFFAVFAMDPLPVPNMRSINSEVPEVVYAPVTPVYIVKNSFEDILAALGGFNLERLTQCKIQ